MFAVNETRFFVQPESMRVNLDWMKIHIIQSKNEIMMNVGVGVRH